MSNRMSEKHRQYALSLETQIRKTYKVAKMARKKGLDPSFKPETGITKDLAALVEGLVGPSGVGKSIRQLSEKLPREELAFKIAEEIVFGNFGQMDDKEAAEQAVRTALAILTEGITAAPLQGVAKVDIKSNSDKTRYLAIYFAGPIRSAGGTEQALTLVIGDFVRHLLALDRYKPTPKEISRFIEEIRLFERFVGRFQYHVSDKELRNALQYIPVEVTGTESNPVEVSSFRNLPRVETNRLRGGALRVVNDGVIGRSAKVRAIVEKLGIDGWNWLKGIGEIKAKKNSGFMDDVIAGRPIFSLPNEQGGFRLRYGRARNTGLAAVGINPTTMAVLQGFIAAGTQLRLELPGKGGVALPVDSIEPPIVRLKDGTVLSVDLSNFKEVKDKIDKILFLGDILISFGDFLYSNKSLLPSGYTEEWWCKELRHAIVTKFSNLTNAASISRISASRLRELLEKPLQKKPDVEEALTLATTFKIPLHPHFIFFWSKISVEELKLLRLWILKAKLEGENGRIRKIQGDLINTIKALLERICVPHKVRENKIVLYGEEARIFSHCLGAHLPRRKLPHAETTIETIEKLSGLFIREKAPCIIGARMGRPEKAKRRELKPLVHLLFPLGTAGGSHRNIIEASKRDSIWVDLVKRRCINCNNITTVLKCPGCGSETTLVNICPTCGRSYEKSICPTCKVKMKNYEKRPVNIKNILNIALKKLKLTKPSLVKGVKGLMNETKTPEILEKGLLRAKFNLSVYKDGTIRFDATNAPLTHFTPSEISTTITELHGLGYILDDQGDPLTSKNQICELKIQDVIVPTKCAEYFVRVAKFLDTLLERVYALPPYYKVKITSDLIGKLVIGLAPHTSVGIVGRIIGFTDLNVCYAHPLWHSAKRRDCDGDEDALMLALDTMINFSREYLPAQIGGIMDAPLMIIPLVNPAEVQRQAHELDVAEKYPLEFFEVTKQLQEPRQIGKLIDIIEYRLHTSTQFEGFNYTTPVSNINLGNKESVYKKLKKMTDKLQYQLDLADKIQAVDVTQVALKVLTTHFIRDIAGNLRAFTTQGFRCKSCNRKFRRIPLKGKCPWCDGALTLTVYRGGIEKYLNAAQKLIEKYGLPEYFSQRLSIVKEELNALFDGKNPRQISITNFV